MAWLEHPTRTIPKCDGRSRSPWWIKHACLLEARNRTNERERKRDQTQCNCVTVPLRHSLREWFWILLVFLSAVPNHVSKSHLAISSLCFALFLHRLRCTSIGAVCFRCIHSFNDPFAHLAFDVSVRVYLCILVSSVRSIYKKYGRMHTHNTDTRSQTDANQEHTKTRWIRLKF